MPIKLTTDKSKAPAAPDTSAADAQAAAAKHQIQAEEASYVPPAASMNLGPTYAPPAGANFLMTGAHQQSQIGQMQALSNLRSKLDAGARDFWLKAGEFAKVFFLDGKIIGPGVFDTPMVNVHKIQVGGKFKTVLCLNAIEGRCVLCEKGEDVATLQLFTVINTRPYTIQSGPRRGTVLPATLQLFPATMKAREKLFKRAEKNGGALAGALITCSRTDPKGPRVGDDFEFEQNVPIAAVVGKYPMLGSEKGADGKWKDAPTKVIDYTRAYPMLTNAELVQLRPDLGGGGFSAESFAPQSAMGGGVAVGDDELPF